MNDEQRYKQYLLEKELANKISPAIPEERKKLIKGAYTRLYSEAIWLSEVYRVLRKNGMHVLDKPADINGTHGISRGIKKFLISCILKNGHILRLCQC